LPDVWEAAVILLAFLASFGFVFALFAGACEVIAHKRFNAIEKRVNDLERAHQVPLDLPLDLETARDPFDFSKRGDRA
jgi:hypothetical protein